MPPVFDTSPMDFGLASDDTKRGNFWIAREGKVGQILMVVRGIAADLHRLVGGRLAGFSFIFIKPGTQLLRHIVNFPSDFIKLAVGIRLDRIQALLNGRHNNPPQLCSEHPRQNVLGGCCQDGARSDLTTVYSHLRQRESYVFELITRCALPRGDKFEKIIQSGAEAFLSRLETSTCLGDNTELGMQASADRVQLFLKLLGGILVLTFDLG
ncbi:MAG: hypothetical protein Q9184_005281 [Pyrenodesmia sp. 2 TL-2023]